MVKNNKRNPKNKIRSAACREEEHTLLSAWKENIFEAMHSDYKWQQLLKHQHLSPECPSQLRLNLYPYSKCYNTKQRRPNLLIRHLYGHSADRFRSDVQRRDEPLQVFGGFEKQMLLTITYFDRCRVKQE